MFPYFYHKDLNSSNNSFNLTEETSKHCIQVLRMQEGEKLKLTNGKGLVAVVEIATPHKKNTLVNIKSFHQEENLFQKNTIAISLLKNTNRLEWFLEKATELGIYEIVPLLCKRTERQIFKQERFETILISAMLQSQQSWLPILQQPIKANDFINKAFYGNKFIAHCEAAPKKDLHTVLQKKDTQLMLIGPEGDFDSTEIDLALQNSFIPVSLGNTRLRTETAGIVAAALMQVP